MMRSLRSKCNSISLILVVLVLSPVAASVWAEEEEKPTASVTVDFLNQYIWRGYALSGTKGMVIEPSVTVGYKGFSLNVWGNLDTYDQNPVGPTHDVNWNETDLTLVYSHEIYCGLNGSIGVIYYALDQVPDSFEVFGSLSYAFPWLTVAFTTYREASHYPGWWFQLDLTRNQKLPWYGMSLDLGMSFFYQLSDDPGAYPSPSSIPVVLNGGTTDDAYSAFHAGIISAALNIPLGKYFTISPKVGYAFPLSGDARDEIKYVSWDHDGDHVFGGARLSFAF